MTATLAHACHAELLIKKSRFIGCVEPISDKDAASQHLQTLRAEHPAAAHICWAMMAAGHSAANDDGEPSGTAGRPMLEVLRHQGLESVLATVVRYYGGIKLGAGGLVRAYTDSVARALDQAERIELIKQASLRCSIPYALEGKARRLIQQHGQLLNVQHGSAVTLHISCDVPVAANLQQQLAEACHGQLQWLSDE